MINCTRCGCELKNEQDVLEHYCTPPIINILPKAPLEPIFDDIYFQGLEAMEPQREGDES